MPKSVPREARKNARKPHAGKHAPSLFPRYRFLFFQPHKALAIFAELFRQLPVPELEFQARRPGFGVRLGIVDGDVVDQVIVGRPAKALDHVQLVAVRVADPVNPGPFVKVDQCRRPACRPPVMPDRNFPSTREPVRVRAVFPSV